MSLSSTLSNAVSGLNVAQSALATTASNVANVNTPGYSRKIAEQTTLIVAGQGAGVRGLDVTRITNDFMTDQARVQAIELGRSQALADVQGRIQDTIFGEAGDTSHGITDKLSGLLTSLDRLAASPEEVAARGEVVGKIADVLRTLDQDMAAVRSIRGDVDQQIGQVIGSINGDLADIAGINAQFVSGRGSADLADRRDELLAQLAGKIDIQVGRHQDGSVEVTTRNGSVLVDGPPRQIVYEPASSTATNSSFGRIAIYASKDVDPKTGQPRPGARSDELVGAGSRTSLSPELLADGADTIVSNLRGGSLDGLLQSRDRVLPELADQLGELGEILRFSLNAAHNASSPTPAPTSLIGSRTGLNPGDPITASGTTTFAVVDRSTGVAAATFALDLSTLTTVDDLVAAIGPASSGMLTASLSGDGRLSIVASDPSQGMVIAAGDGAIESSDAAGRVRSFGLAHFFGLNDLVVGGDGDRAGALRPDIVADPFKLSSARLDISTGSPLGAVLGGPGDGRGAAALAAGLRTPVAAIARGGLPAYATTPYGYATDITSLSAARASEATTRLDADQALSADLQSRIGSLSGVNLDEEMSRLILYQQAYSASAQIISITNQLFDDLMQIAR